MITLPITLHPDGSVSLPGWAYELQLGYTASRGVYELQLGYTASRGVYALQVEALGVWQGLVTRAVWHPPEGDAPPGTLVSDGLCVVPAAVTAQPGRGRITFEGTDGAGTTITSADLPYRVAANSGTDDGTLPEPGTPAWEAFVAEAVKTRLNIATEEEVDAMLAEIYDN